MRFDPLEAGKNILIMEEIGFYVFQNPSLSMNTRGYIDQENMSISVIMPPSLDMTANKLIAECRIREISYYESGDYHILINRFWNNNDTVALDRKDFDPNWAGDSSFVNEYTMKIEREFLSKLELLSPKYSSSPDFSIRIRFNDLAEPAFDPPTLDEMDFIAGLSGVNFNTPGVVQITTDTPVPQPLPAAGYAYNWTLNAPSEGPVNVTFLAGSVLHNTPPLISNTASNTLYMVYDATSPTLPSAPDDAVIVTNLDLLTITDNYNDAILSLSFEESSDLLTARKNLRYSFYFSDIAADVTGTAATVAASGFELFYLGNKYVPYQSKYTWSFNDMPQLLKDRLLNGTTLFFNVIVQDLANNDVLYSNGNITYQGPDYP